MPVPAKKVDTLPSQGGSAILALINKASTDRSFDVEKFERLIKLGREIEREERDRQINAEFNAALSRVQQQVAQIARDADNPQTRSKYATYGALDRAVRDHYTAEGFSISFNEIDGAPENHLRLACYLKRGDIKETFRADVPIITTGIQGKINMTLTHARQSAKTYGKRSLLSDIFNLATIDRDDDGNAAGGGNGNTINEDQLTKLQLLISDVGGKNFKHLEHRFLKYRGISSLDQLLAKEFEYSLTVIENQRKNYATEKA